MVRVPASYRGTMARHPAQSGYNPQISPLIRLPRVTDISRFDNLVTTDLGNDGVAPLATFTAGGTAYGFCGPAGLGSSWSLDQCYLSTSVGQLDASQVVVCVGPFMGPAGLVQQYQVTSSLAGGGSQFGLGGLGLEDGWFVQAFWTGGTAGALAQLRVTGLKT